jgi:transcriptional repressor NrdR
MKCPFCQNADTQVIDSRASDEGATIRRRRKCLACDKRFTTYERVELAMPTIIKRGGGRADYDRDKLRASMQLSLRKRPVPREAVDDAIAKIEDKLLSAAQREVKSEKLGELVMRELKRLDKVAYIRFASVYRSFEDVDEFAEVVREVRPAKRPRRRAARGNA